MKKIILFIFIFCMSNGIHSEDYRKSLYKTCRSKEIRYLGLKKLEKYGAKLYFTDFKIRGSYLSEIYELEYSAQCVVYGSMKTKKEGKTLPFHVLIKVKTKTGIVL